MDWDKGGDKFIKKIDIALSNYIWHLVRKNNFVGPMGKSTQEYLQVKTSAFICWATTCGTRN